jgi:hypothetical protein
MLASCCLERVRFVAGVNHDGFFASASWREIVAVQQVDKVGPHFLTSVRSANALS